VLADISADSFGKWRESAKADTCRSKNPKAGRIIKAMSPRCKNHYFEALRTFCRWCVKRHRIASNPIADVEKVDQTVDVRRQRRALITADEITALLAVVPSRHQLAYRMILSTGLRRDELKH
jgi:integrase